MSPAPIVNEIIAAHANRATVAVGDMVIVAVDRVYIQDGNSPTLAQLFHDYDLTCTLPTDRVGFFFDHSVIVPESRMADRLREAEQFAEAIGARVFGRGSGISHVVALEQGWFRPGDIVLGADSHTCTGGAVQCLALGMGATDIAAAMVTGTTWLRVPQTVWLCPQGVPHPATRPKDIVLHILRSFGQENFLYRSVEWCGDWVSSLPLDATATLASMAVELGAKCTFLPDGPGRPPGMRTITPPIGAASVLTIDLDGLSPAVALPHSPSNVVSLEQAAGQKIDYVFIGSCTNSRLDDIAEVAQLLARRTIARGVHCILTPGSKAVYLEALRAGYLEALISAGVLVTPPGCGPCVGTQGSIPADGERVFSTMNRNFMGRMGNPKSEIYLGSPLVAAHVALLGHIPSPSELIVNAKNAL